MAAFLVGDSTGLTKLVKEGKKVQVFGAQEEKSGVICLGIDFGLIFRRFYERCVPTNKALTS